MAQVLSNCFTTSTPGSEQRDDPDISSIPKPLLAPSRRRGFLLLDTLGGLLLVAALATVLAVMLNRQNLAEQKLADSRTAVRLAERLMTELQTSANSTASPDEETRISIAPADGQADVPGFAWVEVQITFRGQRARLVGLVPQETAAVERKGS